MPPPASLARGSDVTRTLRGPGVGADSLGCWRLGGQAQADLRGRQPRLSRGAPAPGIDYRKRYRRSRRQTSGGACDTVSAPQYAQRQRPAVRSSRQRQARLSVVRVRRHQR